MTELYNIRIRAEQTLIEEAVEEIDAKLHDAWRNTYQHPRVVDGHTVYGPKIKVLVRTQDGQEEWFDDGDQPQESVALRRQDIANTPNNQLDPHWRDENRRAAEVAVDVMRTDGGRLDLTDRNQRNYAGDRIHRAWLARNPDAQGGSLDAPFTKLSADEQGRDIEQAQIAQDVLRSLNYPAYSFGTTETVSLYNTAG